MKGNYQNNIHILTKVMIEELEESQSIQKLSMGAKAAYKGITIMFIGFFFKIFWNRLVPPVHIIELYKIMGWGFLFTCFLLAGIQFDKAYHYTVDRKFKNSEWLKYIGIPMFGKVNQCINRKQDSYEFVPQVDFTVLKALLDKDYIRYIVFYEELVKEKELSLEKRKYMCMMNILAALKDEKGFMNKIEKCLLAQKIKRTYKKLN